MSEPARARALLSTADFRLIRDAVVYWMQNNEDDPKTAKFSLLYHRLGSFCRD